MPLEIAIATVVELVLKVSQKIEEITAMFDEGKDLSKILLQLVPIVQSLSTKFDKRSGDSGNGVLISLQEALFNAEKVVDYIGQHPIWSSIRSGKYKRKLREALQQIDAWLLRVQPLVGDRTLKEIGTLQADVRVFSKILHEMESFMPQQTADLVRKEIAEYTKESMLDLRNELSTLLQVNKTKSARFQEFLNEEEERMVVKLIDQELLKDDDALQSFLCPITASIMSEPVLVVVSGNSYESEALFEHFSVCAKQGRKAFDPLTNQAIKRPYLGEGVVLNRGLKSSIEEWRVREFRTMTKNGSKRSSSNHATDQAEEALRAASAALDGKDALLRKMEERLALMEKEMQYTQDIKFTGSKEKRRDHEGAVDEEIDDEDWHQFADHVTPSEIVYENGDVYHGPVKDGMRHGKGVLEYNHDERGRERYTGYFAFDVPNGKGKMEYTNGDTYDGEWAAGHYDGAGVYCWGYSGDKYVGGWRLGVTHGMGTEYWVDGDRFTGRFENGAKCEGTYKWADGSEKTVKFHKGKEVETIHCCSVQ